MNYRLLGNGGLRVSEVALGAMTFGEDWVGALLKTRLARSTMPIARRREFNRYRQCVDRIELSIQQLRKGADNDLRLWRLARKDSGGMRQTNYLV